MQQEVGETGGLFCVKDCSLTSIATGEDADNLRELNDGIAFHPG